jgi:hypothetical protein
MIGLPHHSLTHSRSKSKKHRADDSDHSDITIFHGQMERRDIIALSPKHREERNVGIGATLGL